MGGAAVTANFSHMTLDGPALNDALTLMSGLVSTLQTDSSTVKTAASQIAADWTSSVGPDLPAQLTTIANQLQTMENDLANLNAVLAQAVSSIDAAEHAVTTLSTSSTGVG